MSNTSKDLFPRVLCNGKMGVGISLSNKPNTPSFIAKSFEGDTTICFQPQHSFSLSTAPFSFPSFLSCETFPSKEAFTKSIQLFQKTPSLEKIVLARKRTYTFNAPFSTDAILALLSKNFPKEHVFAYQTSEHEMFFGASPENLYKRKGNTILVDCLAGTATKENKNELFSDKNKQEHQFVTRFVEKALKDLCTDIATSALQTKDAANLVHLYQTVTGTLLPGVTDEMIIEKLHPTPATLGYPKKDALLFLEENAPFTRELYAGILGWRNQEEAFLKVNLRCGKISGSTLTLYAGAGITKQSSVQKELEEIDHKFNTLEGILFEYAMSK